MNKDNKKAFSKIEAENREIREAVLGGYDLIFNY